MWWITSCLQLVDNLNYQTSSGLQTELYLIASYPATKNMSPLFLTVKISWNYDCVCVVQIHLNWIVSIHWTGILDFNLLVFANDGEQTEDAYGEALHKMN